MRQSGLIVGWWQLNRRIHWSSSRHHIQIALDVEHSLLPIKLLSMGIAQVVNHVPLRHEAKVSAISPQGQPLVQLMLPAARELASEAQSRPAVGASGLRGFLA